LLVERSLHNSFTSRKRLGRKEPGHAAPHRDERRAVHGPIEPEAEEPRVALLREFVDGDVVADRCAYLRQPAIAGVHPIEQPVNRKPASLAVDAEEAREEEVRLPGLDGNRRRDATGFEIPAVGANSVLGDHPAASERERFALDLRDAVY